MTKKILYLKNAFQKTFTIFLILIAFSGCESFVDTNPPSTHINSLNVFSQNNTAIAAVTEMYGKAVTNFTGNTDFNVTLNVGLSADEFTLFSGVTRITPLAHYKNELRQNGNAALSSGGLIWSKMYEGILSANSCIEGLNLSNSLYPLVKRQLLGESYFMRAFYYYYLVNLYGDAPLVLGTDPNINNDLARTQKNQIYEQIVVDLQTAKELLNDSYVNKDMLPYGANAERIRPNRWAATALLARVYLSMNNKDADAEKAATEVISNSFYRLLPLNEVFLKNSAEAIWQLQPVRTGRNTDNGFMFILPGTGPNATSGVNGNPVSLSNSLMQSFESGDSRSIIGNWIDRITTATGTVYYYPFKYKVKAVSVVTEYEMVLRLAEQYLIRAEARAKQGKLIGVNSASSDLNLIRNRAGLASVTINNQLDLLDAILKERRVELFSEWGHRWLDLKRTNKIKEIMSIGSVEKGGNWQDYQQLFPIPFADIQRGPNLKQNPGYN